jgi:hypothetical protein
VAQGNLYSKALGAEAEPNSVLFVLFIPSKDKDGNDLPEGNDQELWADAAGDLLTELFVGSTQMPAAKGKWLNEETNEIITEKVVLVHSYAQPAHAEDEAKLKKLAVFLRRMGKKTKQGEVAVLIDGQFRRIRKYTLAK